MTAAVSTIEGPYEDPSMNWRRSFFKLYEGTREQLKAERAKAANQTYDALGRVWRPFDLDDDELDALAREEARKAVERAIREHDSKKIADRVKRRQGKAL